MDLEKGKLVGEKHILTSGHAKNALFCEASHIYKISGKYYLVVAEGGTWENHSVNVFAADKVTGPYIAARQNPVLTHRQLGKDADITTIGHADLIQTQNGDWWAVMLGVRPVDRLTMLGRETFLTSVKFEDGWPVFNPLIGRVLFDKTPALPALMPENLSNDQFNSDKLSCCWQFLRTPFDKWYSLSAKKGFLTINLRPESITELVNPSLIARRIEDFNYSAAMKLIFKTKNKMKKPVW